MKAQSKLGVLILAGSLLAGCNVYIDVPVAVGPNPTPVATEAPAATPAATPAPTAVATPVVTEAPAPTPVVTAVPPATVPNEPDVAEPGTMSVNLQWTPPSQREDGSLLQESELSKYEIRYRALGVDTFEVVQVDATQTNLPLVGLPIANYEFQIAVIDTDGLYSDFVSATQ